MKSLLAIVLTCVSSLNSVLRKDSTAALKCKNCVAAAAEAERKASASKQSATTNSSSSGGGGGGGGSGGGSDGSELSECSVCKNQLPAASFNKTQLRKGPGKQRCMECVTAAEQAEHNASAERQKQNLADLRQQAKRAEATGGVVQKLLTASAECAAEAEAVTGLKPVILGRGRKGRGGSGGRGAARGRGRGGSSGAAGNRGRGVGGLSR